MDYVRKMFAWHFQLVRHIISASGNHNVWSSVAEIYHILVSFVVYLDLLTPDFPFELPTVVIAARNLFSTLVVYGVVYV